MPRWKVDALIIDDIETKPAVLLMYLLENTDVVHRAKISWTWDLSKALLTVFPRKCNPDIDLLSHGDHSLKLCPFESALFCMCTVSAAFSLKIDILKYF